VIFERPERDESFEVESIVLCLTDPSREFLPHEREDLFMITIDVFSSTTKILTDDREKHIQADENSEQHEQTETEGSEKRLRLGQFPGIEFHQAHFE
jgi:hypothetical protein